MAGRAGRFVPSCRCALVIMSALVVSPSLSAQWPAHLSDRVPRTADGAPNLTAPAPRTADGTPDLSGTWQNFRSGREASGANRPVNEAFFEGVPPSLIGLFRDVGSGVAAGLPMQPWAADLVKARMAENSKDNPDAHCLPLGLMQLHTHPDPRKIVQAPQLILVMYEANYGLRQIFLDGRPLPQNDPQPWWYGYSVGRWQGDTLVVETSGFRDGGWLDVNGSPLTDRGKMIERFRRVNYGTLEIEITVDDPKAYTKPWTVTVTQRLMPDAELIEFICLENEKDAQHFVGK
jgi:hypothetical protein